MPGTSAPFWGPSPDFSQDPTASASPPHVLDKLLGRIKRPPGAGINLLGGLVLGAGLFLLGSAHYWFFDVVPGGPFALSFRSYFDLDVVGDVLVGSGTLLLALGWARVHRHADRSGRLAIPPSQWELDVGAALAVLAGAGILGTFLFIAYLDGVAAAGGTLQVTLPSWADPISLPYWAGGSASILWAIGAFVSRPFVKTANP